MEPLSHFPLPLTNLPDGYHWEERDLSDFSTTTAFNTGINQRDRFLGLNRCIICGLSVRNAHTLDHCRIIPKVESGTWINLKDRGWIPEEAKGKPRHEPRNGLYLCSNHHGMFDKYSFFIRFVPDIQKFVFINYSSEFTSQEFHGKAIALDINDRHAPFPSLFIIHEMRVRGFHPFASLNPAMPRDSAWQDWILSDSVFDDVSCSFKRNRLSSVTAQPQLQFMPVTTNAGGASSGGHTLAPLNANVIAEILAATHAMPSWKACQMEGTSWTGTAEGNVEKYVSSIGISPDIAPNEKENNTSHNDSETKNI